MRLKDKVVLITGASSGIGKATAFLFAKEGAIVYAGGTNLEKLDTLKREKGDLKIFPVKIDVTDRENIKNVVLEIIKKYERIDILINNAGITMDSLLIRMKEEQWDKVININLKGVFNVTQAVIPYMLKQKEGVVLSTTSIVGMYGNAGQTNYAAAKAGIIGMTYSWAKEYGKKGIRFNAVAPGYIETDMTNKIPDSIKKGMISMIPLQRIGKPDDVAKVFLFLASEDASYITGEVITVSGGLKF